MKRNFLLLVLTMLCTSVVFGQQKKAGLRPSVISAKSHAVAKPAPQLAPTEDEIVKEQPAGTLKTYVRTGMTMIAEWGDVYEYEQNGSIAKVVFSDDGESVWFYCPMSGISYPVWVKGTLSADGKTISIPAGALVLYAVTEPNPWEDYEGGEVYGLRLHILEIKDNGDGSYTYDIAEGDPDIEWTIDDTTGALKLTSTDVDAFHIMGTVYDSDDDDNGYWNGYADYATVYVPFEDQPQTAPEGLKTEEYAMLYEYNDGWNPVQTLGKLVQVGFDGDDVYVTKFSKDYPDTWIKGTIKGDEVRFPRQMLTINQYNDAVYFNAYTSKEVADDWGWTYIEQELSLEDVVFKYDADTRSFSTDMNCNVNPSAIQFSGQEMFEKPSFTLFIDKPATPADPEITYFECWEDDGLYRCYASLNIPTVDTEGNFIDPSKLSFCFYTSETELYHFVRDNYIRTEENDGWNFEPAWEDGMTEIPYSYSDEDGQITNQSVMFRYGELPRLGIQTIYRGGGEEHRSNIYFYGEGIVDGIALPRTATTQETGAIYYDLTGRRVPASAKGIYVEQVRKADGTVTTRKVVRR